MRLTSEWIVTQDFVYCNYSTLKSYVGQSPLGLYITLVVCIIDEWTRKHTILSHISTRYQKPNLKIGYTAVRNFVFVQNFVHTILSHISKELFTIL